MAAVTTNNVYVHSSPPKAISGTGVAIRQWVKTADIEKLEQVILDGQGARLLGLIDTAADPKVKVFLRSVPSFMAKVDLIHDAVIRGNLRELQALIDKRKFATGKDAVGRGLLHKAVLYNHKSIIDWLGKKYPEMLQLKDNEARTALHYTAVSKDPDELFSQLIRLGAKETMDIHGRKPTYYINHPENLDIEGPRSVSNNRNKRPRLESTPTLTKPISSTITRAQIRIWIHERDVAKLENIVWSGNGDKLLLETTNNPKVKRFLTNVPHLLARIKAIHTAAINNDVETMKDLRAKTEILEVFTAKDAHGLTALHKGAGLGHRQIVEWYLFEFPNQLLNEPDNEGKTPLHYASKDTPTYNFLLKAGASEGVTDNKGKTALYYRRNQGELDGRHLRNIPDAPRIQGELTSWDRVVTSPGGILDPKRRISNGEFNDDEQPPTPLSPVTPITNTAPSSNHVTPVPPVNSKKKLKVSQPSNKPLTNGFGGKHHVAESSKKITSPVDYDEYDDFEPEDEEIEDTNNNNNVHKTSRSSKLPNGHLINRTPKRTKDHYQNGKFHSFEDDENENAKSTPDLTPPHEPSTPEPVPVLEPQENGQEEELEPEEAETQEPAEDEPAAETTGEKGFIVLTDEQVEALENEAKLQKSGDSADGPGGTTDEAMDDTPADPDDPAGRSSKEVIDSEDMEQLVQLVLDGRGNELLDMKSANPDVQEFITNIPAYMAKIASIHGAAASGNLRDLQTILDRKRLAFAKDPNGLVPLHKAVLFGHSKVIRYLASNFSQSINTADNNGRTPLHYAATLPDAGVTYRALIASGADPNLKDLEGNTPGIYLRNKQLLSHEQLVKANNNINFSMIPSPPPALSGRSETWQRPPSVAGNTQHMFHPVPDIHYIPPATPLTNPVSPKTLDLIKDKYRELVSEDSVWAKIRNRLTNKNSATAKEYIQKYLTAQVFNHLCRKSTDFAASLLDVIKYYPQFAIVAPDPHAYVVFKELFTPAIYDYAKFSNESRIKLTLAGDNQFPAIWSDEGKYLASVLGDALVKGLTRVSEQRPEDPVEYLANFLRTYKGEDGEENILAQLASSPPLSPGQQEYDDAIAAAADAAIITSVPLHTSSSSPSHLLENVQEQTEESGETGDDDEHVLAISTSESPLPADDEQMRSQSTEQEEEQPMEEDQNEPQPSEEDQEQFQVEQEPQEDTTQQEEPETSPETEDINEDSKPEQDQEMSHDEQEPTPEETEEATQDSPVPEAPDAIDQTEDDQAPAEQQEEQEPSAESDESHVDAVAQLQNNEHSLLMNGTKLNENDKDADDLLRRLDDEVEEQQTNAEDAILPVQTDLEEEIEGAGQRDDRGQSVLHFAAARPGGSITLLAFLQNPLVNLAWRDENLKTARDVASSLGRSENVQTIDSYVVSKAVAGDYEAMEKLMLDGYDNLNDVEDSTKTNINTLAAKAGHDKVLQLLESVPQFRDNVEKLMDSIRLGDLERVKDLVEADPRLAIAMGKLGRTPLHVAVLCEEYPIVQYLAHEFPATLRRGDNLERTALHYAMGIEKVEKMTRILVRMGAKRVVKDIKGRQPSYYFINREEIALLQEEERS